MNGKRVLITAGIFAVILGVYTFAAYKLIDEHFQKHMLEMENHFQTMKAAEISK